MSVKPEKEEEEGGVSSSAEFQDPPLVFSSHCCLAVGPPAERNQTLAHSKWIRSGPIAAVLHVSGCWFDLQAAEEWFCFWFWFWFWFCVCRFKDPGSRLSALSRLSLVPPEDQHIFNSILYYIILYYKICYFIRGVLSFVTHSVSCQIRNGEEEDCVSDVSLVNYSCSLLQPGNTNIR